MPLLSTIFLPHRYCMGLNPELIWLSVITDALVALSYYSIPAALFVLAFRRRQVVPVQPILILFGLFIAFCGAGHAMDIVSLWKPIYWLKAWWNTGTAVTSVITAVVLIPQVYEFVRMPEAKARLEREKTELEERQSLLHAVLDAAVEGIVLTDETGGTILHNAAAAAILNERGATGAPHVSWRAQADNASELVRLPNGRLVAHLTRMVPGFGRLYVLRDLTEIHASDEQRRRLEHIVQTMRQGFCILARDTGTLLSTNPSFDRMYGYPEGQLAGTQLHRLLSSENAPSDVAVDTILAKAEKDGFWDGETQNRRADGTTFIAAVRVNRHEADSQTVFSLIQTDITEAKRLAEESRRLQAKMLQTAKLESVGVLAGGIAHDFNNLLTGILGNTSLVYEQLSPSSALRKRLHDVIRAGERAAELIRQLLAYSGKGRFLSEAIEVSALIAETRDLVRLSVPPRVKVELNFGGDIYVEADRGQMQQLFMNLVINGAEAIPEEREGRLTVTTAAVSLTAEQISLMFSAEQIQPGDYALVEVTDNGIGMNAGTLAQIFDPFFTTKFTGRGLGLAAALGIVRGHGGAIHVYSEVGIGTSFRVFLPLARTPHTTGSGQETLTPVAFSLRGSGTVLVIDDEEQVREAATHTLEYYGYKVLAAPDGRSGIEVFERFQNEVKLVLLDLTMPGLSGEETLRALRAIRPDVRIVLSSGFSEREALRKFSRQSLSGFLQKPYTASMLADMVRAATAES